VISTGRALFRSRNRGTDSALTRMPRLLGLQSRRDPVERKPGALVLGVDCEDLLQAAARRGAITGGFKPLRRRKRRADTRSAIPLREQPFVQLEDKVRDILLR
jgi:hypothetical protein